MKTIMITAPSSNMGKTTISIGLLRAMKKRDIDISAFKTGPDLIDKEILKKASKKPAGNLDIFLMGQDNLKKALYLNNGDFGLIEGAMGYFDGIANTFKNSSYDISEKLDVPAILVYRPKGEMFTMIPKIKGMVDFSKNRIKGIIFNGVSESMYNMIKPMIKEHTDIEPLGYLSKLDIDLEIGDLTNEIDKDLDRKIDILAEKIEKTIDIDKLIKLAVDIETERIEFKKTKYKLGIAKDEVFNYIYNENSKILENTFEIEDFSPLKDELLPEVDLVYFPPVGTIKNYLNKLSENKGFINSLKKYIESEGILIAEGDSTLYLLKELEGYEMAKIYNFNGQFTNRLKRFGYGEMEFLEDNLFGKKGEKIHINEYHKSEILDGEEEIFKIRKPLSNRNWECGYSYKNTLAFFGQINLLGNLNILENLIKRIGEKNVY